MSASRVPAPGMGLAPPRRLLAVRDQRRPKTPSIHSRSTLVGAVFYLSAALAGGCASPGKEVVDFDSITLAPGGTGNCDSSPCPVYLEIPAGTGSYEVTANETRVGSFPAGQTANLGSFWQGQALQILGLEVPKYYAWIPAQRCVDPGPSLGRSRARRHV